MKQNIEQEKSIINETLLNSIPGGIIIVNVSILMRHLQNYQEERMMNYNVILIVG